jgi:hypothetical protein
LTGGADIHTEDLCNLHSLLAWAGANLEGGAGRHASVATAFNHARMQERVTGTVCQPDEAKAFVRVVPLDGGFNGGPGGAVKLRTTRRRVSEIARRRLVIVISELAAASWAKISVSVGHVSGSQQ